MSPEEYTDPDNTGLPGDPSQPGRTLPPGGASTDERPSPSAPGGQAVPEPPDAPWWHQPHPGAPAWGSQDGWPQDDAGQGGVPQGGWQQGPYGPYAYGYGPGAAGPGAAGPDAAGPGAAGPDAGGWPGSQWGDGPWGWASPSAGWGPQAPPPPPDRPRRKGVVAVVAAAFTALALLIGVGIGYDVWSAGGTPTPSRSFVPSGGTSKSAFTTAASSTPGTKVSSATGAPSNIATIRAKVKPALVDINTVLGYETEEAAGTGMVLTSTGKILTNNHVIEEATKISATDLGNGRTYSATVLGYTRTDDIAVIQLKGASGLKTVQIGNSSTVKVGEAIVGIGNAGGTGGVPSAAGGSVTALDQSITASDEGSFGTTYEHLTGLIESNADIQPGDSGGPLVTTSGEVVGMDTAASESEGYSFQGAATGQGYSIPINEAVSTARQIIAGKSSASVHIGGTAFLGVYVEAVTVRRRTTRTPFGHFGFGSGTTFTTRTSTSTATTPTPEKGAFVEEVIPGTPAQRSGLAATDVITSVGGSPVTSPTGLTKFLLGYHPGDSVKVGWTTGTGQQATATVTLAAGPPA